MLRAVVIDSESEFGECAVEGASEQLDRVRLDQFAVEQCLDGVEDDASEVVLVQLAPTLPAQRDRTLKHCYLSKKMIETDVEELGHPAIETLERIRGGGDRVPDSLSRLRFQVLEDRLVASSRVVYESELIGVTGVS